MTQSSQTRGITAADVDRAADALLREGERPTIEKVRARIGRGSPNTVNPLLDAWWSRLAARLDAGPAALHRLPEPVLLAAEGLWMQALEEARRRATTELGSKRAALAHDRQDFEIRSHVLSIRESELTARLASADQRVATLETELTALTTLLRKEQASRLAAERRLQDGRQRPSRGRATQPTAASPGRKPNSRKPTRNSSRAARSAGRRLASKGQPKRG